MGDCCRPHLWNLNAHTNLISGTIPPSIGGLTTLRTLNVHDTLLSGSLPSQARSTRGSSFN